jgi:DNA-binding XRE family transcriptional regulator
MKCRQCKSGVLGDAAYVREFYPGRRRVAVELLQSVCGSCGDTRTLSAQHDENLRRLAARKSAYGGLLMGEDYISLRKRYSLTRPQMASVLGVSIRTYTRYENEDAYPVKSTRLLIELAIGKPEVLQFLADKANLVLALREER